MSTRSGHNISESKTAFSPEETTDITSYPRLFRRLRMSSAIMLSSSAMRILYLVIDALLRKEKSRIDKEKNIVPACKGVDHDNSVPVQIIQRCN